MTPEQFVYWFQGFSELHPRPPTAAQWQSIREHVASVFEKETPPLQDKVLAPERIAHIRRILSQPIEEGDFRSRRRGRLIC